MSENTCWYEAAIISICVIDKKCVLAVHPNLHDSVRVMTHFSIYFLDCESVSLGWESISCYIKYKKNLNLFFWKRSFVFPQMWIRYCTSPSVSCIVVKETLNSWHFELFCQTILAVMKPVLWNNWQKMIWLNGFFKLLKNNMTCILCFWFFWVGSY